MILALAALVIWFSVIIGRSPLGLAFGADTATALVTIPSEYRWQDGTPLKPRVDFMYTEVSYGQCSGDDTLLTSILGGTNISAGATVGAIFYVPVGRPLCAVAVVMGMTRQPIGRSRVAEFVIPTGTQPGAPVQLQLRF